MYIVVQFYPWFNCYFPLFFFMLIYDNEYETNKQTNKRKIKIEPRMKLNYNIYIFVLFTIHLFLPCKVVLYSKKVMLGCKSHFFLDGKIVNFKHLGMLS